MRDEKRVRHAEHQHRVEPERAFENCPPDVAGVETIGQGDRHVSSRADRSLSFGSLRTLEKLPRLGTPPAHGRQAARRVTKYPAMHQSYAAQNTPYPNGMSVNGRPLVPPCKCTESSCTRSQPPWSA